MSDQAAIAKGTAGTLRIGGLRAGVFTSWRVVISPTTGKPTLFGQGALLRFYHGALGVQVSASLTPAPTPARIGRPKPPPPKPFTLVGRLVEATARSIVIADGEIAHS